MSPAALLLALALAIVAAVPIYDGPPSFELYNYNPVADPAAVVVSGSARFTVLSDYLIRLEYDTAGKFEDRPTVAILQRKLTVPKFSASTSGGVLTIATAGLTLTYTVGSGPFTETNLAVRSLPGATPAFRWAPGLNNAGNLLGTIKSLDMLGAQDLNCTENANVHVHDESLHCAWGVVSRAGWAVLDDSLNWALTPGAEWWDSRNRNQADWYFFGHGWNYKGALADFTAVGGQIPMIPRYATGIWWTRWFDINNVDMREIVYEYQSRSLPLDVFVLDMDWHKKNNWGGFTFDEHLFPYPADTLGLLHDMGLHLAANIHDDNGVGNYDAMFPELCEAIGLDPNTNTVVPFTVVNKTVAYAVEDIVMEALIEQGMDFWWIDYQQGGTQGGAAGDAQNPTVWTDKLRVTDPKRQGKNQRGLILSRWGGLGTHRYQVGFSGDVLALTWDNLAYQPYFSVTGSNVGYGQWSHDIEGPFRDNEMYLRWIQWGSVSAVLRSHDRGMSAGDCSFKDVDTCSKVKVWDLPSKFFEPARYAMQQRAARIPYYYTLVRQAFDTGVSPMFPMYYNFPQFPNAYLNNAKGDFSQYFLGDDMIVAPVVRPALDSNMAKKSVWVPPGQWYEQETGFLHTGAADGSTILTKLFDLSEIPIFYRAGAVIPSIPVPVGDTLGLAQRAYTALNFAIVPGSSSGSGRVYEDDGFTMDYLNGSSAMTEVVYTRPDSATLSVTVSTTGSFPGMATARTYSITVLNSLPLVAASFTVGTQTVQLPYSRLAKSFSWTYDGHQMAAIVTAPELTTNGGPVTFNLKFAANIDDAALSGLKGAIRKGTLAKRNLDETRSNLGESTPQGGKLMDLSSSGDALSYLAGTNMAQFMTTLQGLNSLYTAAVSEVTQLKGVEKWRQQYSEALLANALN